MNHSSETIRVLRITNRPTIGGPIFNATLLARHLSPGYETLLVAGSGYTHELEALDLLEGIQWVRLDTMGRFLNPLRDIQSFWALRKIIRRFRPHIVHTHTAKPGVLGRLAAWMEGVPVIVHTYHGHVFHSYFHPFKTRFFLGLERWLATFTDALIAISPEQFADLTATFRIADERRFKLIPLGLDLDLFGGDHTAKRELFRQQFRLAEKEVAVVITGRLVPIKNHLLFLQALKRAKDLSNCRIIGFIVGDGDQREVILSAAREMGFSVSAEGRREKDEDLVFTSWRTDLDVINAGVDIVALTSLNEGTPVSLIEASASGRPVVSTRVGGVESVVLPKRTGLLSETGDVEAFASHLVLLAEAPSLRHDMGLAGKEHVRANFGYQRLICDMSQLYSSLLNQKISEFASKAARPTESR